MLTRLKTIFTVLLFLLLFVQQSFAQFAYQIKIQIDSHKDSVYYLANYFGDKYYIADTANGMNGSALFSGNKALHQGIYILANEKKEKLIEFLIGDEQNFTIELKKDVNPGTAKINGSKDNVLFFKHIQIINELFTAQEVMKSPEFKQDSLSSKYIHQKANIDSINQHLIAFRSETIASSPELLFSKILLAMEDPIVPKEMQSNQQEAFNYYKNHFWSSFDLSDDRLLYTPLLPRKLESYFNNLVAPIADSVITEIDKLITMTKGNAEMTEYLVWHFVSEYQTPKIMGLDAVFVYLADTFFENGKMSNLTPSVIEKVKERANIIRPLMIGKTAPDLWLIDTTGSYRSFKELDFEYVVLFFWDHTCSQCKKEAEDLFILYRGKKLNLEVYAINTTNDFDGWKNYINEKKYPWVQVNGTRSMTPDFHTLYDIYGVPVIYLLDKSKKIIGKRINANQIEALINNQYK